MTHHTPPSAVNVDTHHSILGDELDKLPNDHVVHQRVRSHRRRAAERKEHHVKTYKTPKEITIAMLVAAENKAMYGPLRLFVLGIVAGVCVAMGTHAGLSASAVFVRPTDNSQNIVYIPQAQRIVYGLFLPVGLVMISMLGGELYTSNTMTMTVGLWARTVPLWRWFYNLIGVLLGNFAGCTLTAAMLSLWTDLMENDPYWSTLETLVTTKTSLTFVETWLRAVGANLCVCGTIFASMGADDVLGKMALIYAGISAMGFSGYEHLILNFYILPLGLMYHSPTTNFGHVMYKNFLPVLFGNTLAGIIVGTVVYFLYLHDTRIPRRQDPPPLEPHLGRDIPAANELAHAVSWVRRRITRVKSTGDLPSSSGL
jgi:formate transporter